MFKKEESKKKGTLIHRSTQPASERDMFKELQPPLLFLRISNSNRRDHF